jgi:UDP-N-acetylmuramoyl-L-alanyl-D-glutamate--2,6-diaminopimelate ligase
MGVADDSRETIRGGSFVAIAGFETDGHLFLQNALKAGAALLIVERGRIEAEPGLIEGLSSAPLLVVENTRRAAAILASEFYGRPSELIPVHGVTGTKGKTTTIHLAANILTAAGHNPGITGTLGVELGKEKWEIKLTTPGPIEFQKFLRMLVDRGATDVVCEVSAHSGALARTSSVKFATVTYMNLSRDHGDHFTPEAYLDAKLAVSRDAVTVNPDVWGIANARDPHSEAFLEPVRNTRRHRFGAFEETEDPAQTHCDLTVRIISRSPSGLVLSIETADWKREVNLPLIGRFNAQNAAASASIAMASGIDPDRIALGLSSATPVPGRLERIDLGQNFLVVVDYAHAPQPAAEVLAALRDLTSGKLIGVMGAGGSRDRGKRPMIGEILARDCDLAVITSDNPRNEDPLDIINDILVGAQRVPGAMEKVAVEPDRKNAIEFALEKAVDGDTVAILGKGHETYQIFKDKTIHFDDREIARSWLTERGYGRSGSCT